MIFDYFAVAGCDYKMKKWFLRLLIFLILLVSVAYLYMRYVNGVVYYVDVKKLAYDYFSATDDLEINVTDSKDSNVTVTSVLDAKIDVSKNMIYCSSLQMAWNELSKNNGETIEILHTVDYLSKMNELINQPPQVSRDAYLTLAGIADNSTKQKIKDALKEKFENQLPPNELNIDLDIAPNDIYAFSFLFKNLTFKKEFKKIESHAFKFNGKKTYVKAFGIEPYAENNEALIKQCDFFYDAKKNSTDFVVRIKSKSEYDEIIISSLKPEESLEKTYKLINDYVNDPEKLHSVQGNSYLKIPKINFNISMNYNKMLDKITTGKYKEYFIKKVFQKIKFNLNEKGSYLLSYAYIGGYIGDRQIFIINRPFCIYLKDKTSSKPYFMAYIADDSLLVKSDEQGGIN